MIALDDARLRMLEQLTRLDYETVELEASHGRILAEPVIALRTQPPFAASAMDGYAVRSADLRGPESRLKRVGESAAGHAFDGPLPSGAAVRISTGAPVPGNADQVVIQENTQQIGDHIRLRSAAKPGANIRPAGIDFERDETLLAPGRALSGAMIALAAAAGSTRLCVYRRPRVGLFATGDELVEPGCEPGPSQIINAITPGLIPLIEAWGGDAVYLGIAGDNPSAISGMIEAAGHCDLLVSVGGASVGDHDHLRSVFDSHGGQLLFEKIAVKPGKPTWVGQVSDTPMLGLPGNPVSALVMARLMLRPAIARLSGFEAWTVFEPAICAADLPENGPRETFLRAKRGEDGRIKPLARQDSSLLSELAMADCLIRRKPGSAALKAGSAIEVIAL